MTVRSSSADGLPTASCPVRPGGVGVGPGTGAPDPVVGEGRGSADSPRRRKFRSPRRRTPGARSTGRIRLLQGSTLIGLLAVWWAVARFTGVDPVVLPGPGDVLHDLVDTNICRSGPEGSARPECGVQGYFLWQHLLATIERIAVGLGTGTLVGILLGWWLGSSATVRAVVEPYLSFLRALPPLGYIGLLVVWFGIGDQSKVVLLFLAAFPTVTVSTLAGVTGVRRDWILASESLGATSTQIFRTVLLPGALPDIINGVRLAAGLCWAAIVAAEMNDGIPGIGGLAYISGTQLDTALAIACIIVIGVTALLLDQLLLWSEQRYAPWRTRQ